MLITNKQKNFVQLKMQIKTNIKMTNSCCSRLIYSTIHEFRGSVARRLLITCSLLLRWHLSVTIQMILYYFTRFMQLNCVFHFTKKIIDTYLSSQFKNIKF